jgi:hypothetical protein
MRAALKLRLGGVHVRRTALLVLPTAALLALAGSAPGGTRAACGSAKIGGATVITHCGPAKAAVKFGGKTYRFSGGACSVESGYGITAWSLLVGRQTLPPAKPKFSSFQAGMTRKPKAGKYTKGEILISFQLPGKGYILAPGLPHTVTITAGGHKGSFTGKLTVGNRPVSGSWTC